jgi:SOS response regulatory protein OraA/RecX
MTAEDKLRRRIRRVLSDAGLDRAHSAAVMNQLEQQIIQLFKDYADAPDWMKDEVYTSGEAKILRALQRNSFRAEGSTNSGSLAM